MNLGRLFLILFVGSTALSSGLAQAQADWSKPLQKQGYYGSFRILSHLSGKNISYRGNPVEIFVASEIRYRPQPIAGWPNMDTRFSNLLLRMYSTLTFEIGFSQTSLSPLRAVLIESNNGRLLERSILIISPSTTADDIGKLYGYMLERERARYVWEHFRRQGPGADPIVRTQIPIQTIKEDVLVPVCTLKLDAAE